ncbi:O-antigen ligase family protein [Leptothoe spongobia]|uniref:O-antigen ligase family protein n=1 Tax=Leptothoe spongobia TAU-MAC 1115 TaxID=1967444 RepID=A0A947DI69_9CYAN|nr:O-antigen ligase family protein [Leptothoe spongobia]MBT9317468.1 O-antigen ligase family protein [Leptothoe spongobia TAU-MAC 1115]
MNKRYLEIVETGIFVLGIIFYAGTISNKSIAEATGISIDLLDILNSLIRYGLWFSTTLLICARWKVAWAIAKRNKWAWVVAGLSIMSTVWSANPGHTSLVVKEMIRMTTFGLYVASRFKLKEQLHIIASTLGTIALLSALVAIAIPSAGVDQKVFVGAWTGIFTHKNTLGKMMSLTVTTFAVLVAAQKVHVNHIYRILTWGGLYLSYAVVILSTSQTSLSISSLSILLLYSYRLYQNQGNKRRLYLELTSLVCGVAVFIISTSWEIILTSMGRDLTLTGRTEIWGSAISQLFDKSLWLGFGRGTFWAPNSIFARIAGASVGHKYIPPNAHNGYLDLALEIGLIGLVFFLVSFLVAYRHAITRSFVSSTPKDLWPLAFLSWLAAYNLTESSLLVDPNLTWPLYMTVALCAMPSGRAIYLRTHRPNRITPRKMIPIRE